MVFHFYKTILQQGAYCSMHSNIEVRFDICPNTVSCIRSKPASMRTLLAAFLACQASSLPILTILTLKSHMITRSRIHATQLWRPAFFGQTFRFFYHPRRFVRNVFAKHIHASFPRAHGHQLVFVSQCTDGSTALAQLFETHCLEVPTI